MPAVRPSPASLARLGYCFKATVVGAGLGLSSPVVAAETETIIDVVLSIQSPTECVRRELIDDAVRRRSARVRLSKASDQRESAPDNTVELAVRRDSSSRDDEVWRAYVELQRNGAREPLRALETSDCSSLADALGFIIALTFDPPNAKPDETAVDSRDRSAAVSKPTPISAVDAAPVVDASNTPLGVIERHVNMAFEVVSQAGPLTLPGFGVGFELAEAPSPGVSASFATRLLVSAFPGRVVEAGAGQARFRLITGRVALCPLALHYALFTLRPCAEASLGVLNATGRATREPEDHIRPWGTAGGGLWVGVNATSNLRVELDAGIGALLVRDSFQFEPNIFFRTPAANVRASVGLSFLLP